MTLLGPREGSLWRGMKVVRERKAREVALLLNRGASGLAICGLELPVVNKRVSSKATEIRLFAGGC